MITRGNFRRPDGNYRQISDLTEAEKRQIPIDRERGDSWPTICARYNISHNTAGRYFNKKYETKPGAIPRDFLPPVSRISSEEISARLAEIPDDTRSMTGRMFGDPLPGRSALAKTNTETLPAAAARLALHSAETRAAGD